MMSPAEFVHAWLAAASEFDEGLVTATPEALAGIDIPAAAKTFLTEAGLPDSAAPFLGFGQLAVIPLPTLAEAWGLTHDEVARRVYCIGSNGSGDPICIGPSGRVWVFNHDDNFAPTFVNASVAQLAVCLLAYRQLVADTTRMMGSFLDASLNRTIPVELLTRFKEQLQQIDPDAYAGIQDEQGQLLPSMWQQELRALGGSA